MRHPKPFRVPSLDEVALAAADRYDNSWTAHEEELAGIWMQNHEFRCAVDYAIKKVMPRLDWVLQMKGRANEYGGGSRGVAAVVGSIMGEWVAEGRGLDDIIATWG